MIDPDANSSGQETRPALVIALVVLVALAVAVSLAVARASVMGLLPLVIILLVGTSALLLVWLGARMGQGAAMRASREKPKRGLAGPDMYSMIDRLVEDLDEDEAAYLRRRLAEREEGLEQDVRQSLDDLLQQRDHDRRAGKR